MLIGRQAHNQFPYSLAQREREREELEQLRKVSLSGQQRHGRGVSSGHREVKLEFFLLARGLRQRLGDLARGRGWHWTRGLRFDVEDASRGSRARQITQQEGQIGQLLLVFSR